MYIDFWTVVYMVSSASQFNALIQYRFFFFFDCICNKEELNYTAAPLQWVLREQDICFLYKNAPEKYQYYMEKGLLHIPISSNAVEMTAWVGSAWGPRHEAWHIFFCFCSLVDTLDTAFSKEQKFLKIQTPMLNVDALSCCVNKCVLYKATFMSKQYNQRFPLFHMLQVQLNSFTSTITTMHENDSLYMGLQTHWNLRRVI